MRTHSVYVFDRLTLVRVSRESVSNSSFFQSVCVLGYCVFPLNIATLLCMVLSVVVSHVALRMLIVGVGFIWSTKGTSSMALCYLVLRRDE